MFGGYFILFATGFLYVVPAVKEITIYIGLVSNYFLNAGIKACTAGPGLVVSFLNSKTINEKSK